ncbi:MAG TPA: response regulator [Thermoanaerobaculia bacterium]|nr:response regulator [Thermoanaerobaculia bacterium]
MADDGPKRILVIGREEATLGALRDVLGPEAQCDAVEESDEAIGRLESGRYAIVVLDAVDPAYAKPVITAIRRIPRIRRPLLFVLFDDALDLPKKLDPRVVTLLIRRPLIEENVREILRQTIRGILAVGGEITLRRLREAGAVRSRRRREEAGAVLVVDDDRAIRELVAAVTRREGLVTDTVPDGETAIERLGSRSYRVLVLDLMMPKLSGWEVIGWLRANPESRPRTVIVCTAADRVVFSELDPEIVNAVFVKPFDVRELGAYVHECARLRRRYDRRRLRIVDPTR